MDTVSFGKKAFLIFVVLVLAGVGTIAFIKLNAPDNYKKSASSATIFGGFQSLVNYGISKDQADLAMIETEKFIESTKPAEKLVRVDTSSIRNLPRDPASTINRYEYTLLADGTRYISQLDIVGLDAMQLRILSSNGESLYESDVRQY